MTHAKLREAADVREKIAALKTNDPTNPAHRLADDLRMSRVSSLEQRDDLIAVLIGGAEKDATITRLEAELSAARAGLEEIACEAERKEGNWVHLKRVIALNARQAAITGGE